METLVLVFDAPGPTLESLAHIVQSAGEVQADHQQVVVEKDDARAYLRSLDDSADEIFADWPVALIPAQPQILALDYSRAALASSVVCQVAAEHRFLIDTNYGAVMQSNEFCRRAADPSWTWEQWPQ